MQNVDRSEQLCFALLASLYNENPCIKMSNQLLSKSNSKWEKRNDMPTLQQHDITATALKMQI